MECTKCNGIGYVSAPDNKAKKCTCTLQKELKAYLPDLFKGHQLAKNFPVDKFYLDLIIAGKPLPYIATFCNTYLTYRFLRDQKYTYEVTTFTNVVESFFEGTSGVYYESDLLILLVYGGYKNRMTEEYLYALLKDRALTKKQTIVYVDPDYNNTTKLTTYLGKSVLDHINKFKKVS